MLRKCFFEQYIDTLYHLILGAQFYGCHPKALEQMIAESDFANDLESSNDNFLNFPFEELFKSTFRIEYPEVLNNDNNVYKTVANIYINLFIDYKKPFAYIFLVLPFEKCVSLCENNKGKELDKINEIFKESLNVKLLPMLIKEKGMTMKKLSLTSKINYHTIDCLCRSNENLYKTSFKNIYKIGKALGVNNNIFLERIDIDI